LGGHEKIVQLLLSKARRPTLKMEITAMRCRRPRLEITKRLCSYWSAGAKVPSSPPTILMRLLSRSLNPFEQALATMTVSASNLPDLGEGGQAIVNISKFSPTNSRDRMESSTSASWSRCGLAVD